MADLEFNFTPISSEDAVGTSRKTIGRKKDGRWKERLNERREARKERLINESLTGVAPRVKRPRVDESQPVKNNAQYKRNKLDSKSSEHSQKNEFQRAQQSHSTEFKRGESKRTEYYRSDHDTGPQKQVISSLFSAGGLPEVEKNTPAAVISGKPSNAPLKVSEDAPVEAEESASPALSALGLRNEIVSHMVKKLNIPTPTQCQASVLPSLIGGSKEVIIQAQTGSGKTLSFVLPLIQDLLSLDLVKDRSVGTLAVILAPTRELAAQIFAVVESVLTMPSSNAFAVSPRALTPCLLVGGANRTHEKRRLRKGCPIIVATPGRLLDHLKTTESFRLAGDPLKKKAGGASKITGTNNTPLGGSQTSDAHLRWLVVDECDRLMDLGFEEQLKGILDELERRSPAKGKRRTVLCSATASEGVERLSSIALENPVVLVPESGPAAEPDSVRSESSEAQLFTTSNKTLTPPSQLVHNYVVCPPKLRFVALLAQIRRVLSVASRKNDVGCKILVFLSCTDAVDFYWKMLDSIVAGRPGGEKSSQKNEDSDIEESDESEINDEDGSEDAPKESKDEEKDKNKIASHCIYLPGVPIYKLHGNMPLASRLSSLNAFSKKSVATEGKNKGKETENAVLFCTSVAARGLDIPFVNHVIQYDLPTEGGVTEYIHRVGRTARAGGSGQATAFLLPSETDWVPWAESGMRNDDVKSKDVKFHQVGVEDILRKGFGGADKEYETRATDVQMNFERCVTASAENQELARNAFKSHIRAYTTHPSAEKQMFNLRKVHLGHLAKSFGMREAPSAGGSKKQSESEKPKSMGATMKMAAKKMAQQFSDNASNDDHFEVGWKTDDEKKKMNKAMRMLRGPTGASANEFQVASTDMLRQLSKKKI